MRHAHSTAKQRRSLACHCCCCCSRPSASMQHPQTQHQQQQHYPPPLNTTSPQQYVAHSPHHQLRTPSHLTTSTSTPAMAVVSHSVDTSSPSPHSQPHSQQRVRDSQQQQQQHQQQQRARSYSSTQPPAALTHSTPSPLSNSSSSFSSSSSSSSSTERWVRECLLKCCQLVLHNRLLLAESDSQLPVNKSFNLHTPEAGITHADWDERMRGREGDVIVLDIVLKGGGRGPVLLERWSLHHDMDEMMFNASPLSSSSASTATAASSSRRVDPTIMFKRMLLLCRSLYSYVRLLPAAALAKQVHTYVEYGKSPPFTLDFSLHTASTSSPASFSATPTSFNFTAVATPRGTFSVSVSYVADLSSVPIGTPQRVQPVMERGELMEDYVGHKASEAQREQPQATRRQSMPVATAYPPRAASALPAFTTSTAHSLPHPLPHQLTHRKSSRSNSHTYVDSYSPGTNTPTFTHGTPPTPSQYPHSLTDTPSFPSSPHLYSTHTHIPHSHSSPMAIAPQPAPSPTTSTSSLSPSGAAASPPIAIPMPAYSTSSSSVSASRLSSQRQSLQHTPPLHAMPATDRLSARSLTSQTPLSQTASRSRSSGSFSPVERALSTPSSRLAGPATAPTTSLSLLASSRSQQRLSSVAPPALVAHSDRNAQLGTLIQWFSSLPPLESSSTTTTAADGGTVHVARMRSVSDALQQLDVLLGKSQQLKERSAAAR